MLTVHYLITAQRLTWDEIHGYLKASEEKEHSGKKNSRSSPPEFRKMHRILKSIIPSWAHNLVSFVPAVPFRKRRSGTSNIVHYHRVFPRGNPLNHEKKRSRLKRSGTRSLLYLLCHRTMVISATTLASNQKIPSYSHSESESDTSMNLSSNSSLDMQRVLA